MDRTRRRNVVASRAGPRRSEARQVDVLGAVARSRRGELPAPLVSSKAIQYAVAHPRTCALILYARLRPHGGLAAWADEREVTAAADGQRSTLGRGAQQQSARPDSWGLAVRARRGLSRRTGGPIETGRSNGAMSVRKQTGPALRPAPKRPRTTTGVPPALRLPSPPRGSASRRASACRRRPAPMPVASRRW